VHISPQYLHKRTWEGLWSLGEEQWTEGLWQ
jgi:hypothetical protein